MDNWSIFGLSCTRQCSGSISSRAICLSSKPLICFPPNSWFEFLSSGFSCIANYVVIIASLPQVSIGLLIFCPVYMHLFLAETVKPVLRQDQHPACLSKILWVLSKRFQGMRDAAAVILSRLYPSPFFLNNYRIMAVSCIG